MVIEYSGNVIRSVLTDKREKYYDGKVRINNPPRRFQVSPQRCVSPTTPVFSLPEGNRLLHVSHRRLRGGRCDGAWQRRALHQPFLRAQLLFSRHHRGQQETHRDLRISTHLPRRGTHLRLQVPHRGGQQQAALQLQFKEVPQVPQLISEQSKRGELLRRQKYRSVLRTTPPTVCPHAGCLFYFLGHSISELPTGRDPDRAGRTLSAPVYAEKTILEEGPFVGIPTYRIVPPFDSFGNAKFHPQR